MPVPNANILLVVGPHNVLELDALARRSALGSLGIVVRTTVEGGSYMARRNIVVSACIALFTSVALLPDTAWPQQASGIAGVARDTSGAVMPGVTVEASSPALIEKVRSVTTDSE